MGMDVFTTKCGAHNRVLKRFETCAECIAQARQRAYLQRGNTLSLDHERIGVRAARTGAVHTPGRFAWVPEGFHPDSCPHSELYDSGRGKCRGCGMTTDQLVRNGYAVYRRTR